MINLPPEIWDGCTAILGRTGSGKSYTARGVVERWLDEGRRVCIIDPTDVWYGLRSNVAGDGPGYPVVVFGGDHGDVPIGDRSGERIAQIIAERNMPAVICTADITSSGKEDDGDSRRAQHRFLSAFLRTLQANNRKPLHLVIDEADDVAPQQPLPEDRRMLGAVDRIVRRGRVRGFRVLMISQRPAVLNKNVLSMASVLVAMRLPGPQDRKAIDAWVKGQAAGDEAANVMATLPGLQIGEGWVWAPESGVLQRLKFPLIRTFDSMRTPEIDEAVIEPTGLAAVELGDLTALLAPPAPPEEGAAASNETAKSNLAAAERQGYARGFREGGLDQLSNLAELLLPMTGVVAEIAVAAGRLSEAWDKVRVQIASPAASAALPAAEAPPALRPAAPRAKRAVAAPERPEAEAALRAELGIKLSPSAGRIIEVLHAAAPLSLSFAAAAARAGVSRRSSAFSSYRREVIGDPEIVEVDDKLRSTRSSIPITAGLSVWTAKLPPSIGRMLTAVVRAERPLSREEIATTAQVSLTSSGLGSGLSQLVDMALIVRSGDTYSPGEGIG